MLAKLLAWISLGTALLFAVIALAGVFAGDALDGMAPGLILWAGLPLLAVSILLAVALLVLAAFHS